jgi:transcriptional regulator GlxA family with amidase domain
MIRVVLALYPRTLATSLALPMDVLQAASQAASVESRGSAQLQIQLAAKDLQPVPIVGGLEITPHITLDQVAPCDMLLLPAMWRNPQPVLNSQQELMALLPELAAAGTTICSIGTASCLLAACGLLDGKAATTHWAYMDEFRRRYPAVKLKQRHLITQHDNLYCAGSVNSGADLMIHLIEDWFGQRVARAVESQFSPEIRRPFRAHAYQSVEDSAHHDELVLSAQQWLQDQLHEPVSMTELAATLGCSTRTLNRRFKNVAGQTPGSYLRSQRLAAARELLRTTNLSVGEVAWQVGLHDVSYFTNQFQRHTGQTPARYRQSVRGKLFSPNL